VVTDTDYVFDTGAEFNWISYSLSTEMLLNDSKLTMVPDDSVEIFDINGKISRSTYRVDDLAILIRQEDNSNCRGSGEPS
jgi:hypothetical protein